MNTKNNPPSPKASEGRRIFIASDHAGFDLKKYLKDYLESLDFSVEDLGNLKLDPNDDYPDFVAKAVRSVVKNPQSVAIVIGGSGQGEAMAANKIKGIRAAVLYDEYSARMSRSHNDANVASLGERDISPEKAKELIKIWIETPFSHEDRHKRRIEKIDKLI